MTGAFGSDHSDIDVGRRNNLRVVQAKAVGGHEHLARCQTWSDVALKYFAVMLVGDQ